jgi:WD40 repeat protein
MFGLGKKTEPEVLTLKSASRLMPEVWTHELDDHVVELRWSARGEYLAAMPSVGRIAVFDAEGTVCAELPGHDGGNGGLAWHPAHPTLTTYGQDATLRTYAPPFTGAPQSIALEKGWADRVAWNPDGTLLAACVGKSVFVLDGATGALRHQLSNHKSTICDIAWNPKRLREIASVCDGGARLWRLGEEKPFGHFDWGGASLIVTWSPNGRWVVTGDQTPSVHLYDTGRQHPLHIQGYETKVKALAWEGEGEWLATGGGVTITLWPCTGKKGPEGVKPIQLFGHMKEVLALDCVPGPAMLVSGGRDGMLLLWMPHRSPDPALIAQRRADITALRWSPDGQYLAFGTAEGEVTLSRLNASLTTQ